LLWLFEVFHASIWILFYFYYKFFLALGFWGYGFCFIPFCTMMAVVLIRDRIYHILKDVPLFLFLQGFYHERIGNFVKELSWIYWYNHVIFVLYLFMCCLTFIDQCMLNNLCINLMKLIWL
jgi:hypothetical protein